MTLDGLDIRPVAEEEYDALADHGARSFHTVDPQRARAVERSVFEFDRSIGVFDRGRLVGSASAAGRNLTVPGGPLPVACVTWVAVAPTHTRRGLLTAMMRRQLTALHDESAEPVAALWASESSIYARFGYGLAGRHATYGGHTREVRLRPEVRGTGLRLGDVADATDRDQMAAVHERVRPDRVGWLDRPGAWWDHRLFDHPADRDGHTALQLVLHDGETAADGYALYAVRRQWSEAGSDGEVSVRELVAATPGAYLSLVGHLLRLDLVRRFRWPIAAPDEPLVHLLEESRRLATGLVDNLWVRLVDVGRALTARRYAREVDIVLDVDDPFCPWNTGRWRLSAGPRGATCARTDAPADLTLGAVELGAAYLGGTRLATLADAGRVRERRRGAVAAASAAFATARPPYCSEIF